MKKCNNCGLEKPISEFYKNKRSKDGLQSNCKSCRKVYKKAYYEANKDKLKAKMRIYNEANKEKLNAQQKAYYEANKDQKIAYKKAYYEANKDKLKACRKDYYEANKDKLKACRKDYYKANKDQNIAYQIEYQKKRILTDPLYKFKCDTRRLIRGSFTRLGFRKGSRTEKILCCTFEYLLEYLNPPEDFFSNRSNYHIDHIIPLSTAKTEQAVIRLCHYTNLRIITAQENLEKSDKTKTNLLELVAW